ncbi:YgjV family protein [Vibrio sp. McD22-P3]|uniref:YgjV family protein n=1 Tax=Vibrio sp. McD22-P3 TaxID=2724880 RepID=UPI001F16D5B9|nr:YgjV family protein [Vibrio sp. McD22-P3]MCF4172225.1 YgjV family protein [Vibrio sp. McD22-P3]
MTLMLFAQLVGGIAFVFGIMAFLQKDDLRFRYCMVAFCFIMMIHFAMMGAVVGAIGVAINGIRAFVSIKTRSKRAMWFFIIILLGMTLPNVSSPVELLPIIGSAVGTWALFSASGIKMRSLILFNSACWFTHNMWIGSIGGSLVEGTFLIANTTTIYRLCMKKHEPA